MKINEIAPLFGIENKDGMFIGKINDFDVQLELVPMGYVKIVYLNVLLNRSITKDELAELNKKTKLRGRIERIVNADFVSIMLSDLNGNRVPNEKKQAVVENVKQIILVLQSLGFASPTTCMICHEDNGNEIVPIFRAVGIHQSVLGLAHSECINKIVESEVSQIQNNNQNTKMIPVSGFLAILGSFLVTLITFLVAVYGGLWLGLLFALIPVAGYFGYKLGKAPLSTGASIFVLAESTIITTIMMYFVIELVAIGQEVSIFEAIGLISSDIIIALIFYVVGVLFDIKYLFGNTNEKKLARLRAQNRQ